MDMKREYYEDIELFKSGTILFWAVVLLAALLAAPLLLSPYYVYLFNLVLVHVIVAVGLNILVGSTGQIALGHAGFFAIGAYVTVLLMTKLQIPFFAAILIAAFISAFFGFVLGLPALRLEGPYLAIATLAFGLAIMHIIGHTDLFGGRQGLMAPDFDIGIPQLGLSYILSSETSKYYLILVITVIMVLLAINILKSRAGRAFVAIRDSDIAAEVIGINLTMYKTLAFAVSAFYAGIAGGLFAFVLGFFDPFTFNLILSIIFLVMVVVGGLGSVMGSISGAVLITYLWYNLFKNVDEVPIVGDLMVAFAQQFLTVTGMDNFNFIALGLVMIGIIIFEPLGMFGAWIRIKKYWKTWPF
ncbi:MAG: branched-chain amino acid ABC transporter permease [Deltaproteobacteria bacterium]|nr:branched-chain amino acid ABC transporter permease [Deltaproteobacteria bacterium]